MVGVAQLVEPRVVIPAVVGSIPIVHPILSRVECVCFGPLAQLVEQLTLNQLVVGSIPTRPTIPASRRESGGTGRRTGFRFQRGNP